MTYSVRVVHTLDSLFDDLKAMPAKEARELPRIVRSNVEHGNRLAQGFSRARSGPHGKALHKRMSAEMTGPTSGEWGLEGEPKSNFVGGGFRNSAPNMDMPDSADIVGPKAAADVRDMLDRLFW